MNKKVNISYDLDTDTVTLFDPVTAKERILMKDALGNFIREETIRNVRDSVVAHLQKQGENTIRICVIDSISEEALRKSRENIAALALKKLSEKFGIECQIRNGRRA
jgi:hypothetical protein